MYDIEHHKVFPLQELNEADAIVSVLSFDKGSILVDGKPFNRQDQLESFLTATVVTSFQGVTTVREYERQVSGTYFLKATSLKAVDEAGTTEESSKSLFKAFLLLISAIYVVFGFATLATQNLSDPVVFLYVITFVSIGYFVRYLETS